MVNGAPNPSIERMLKRLCLELLGLRCSDQQGAGMVIDVSPDYAKKTTPRTLKDRVAEMGQALDLVAKKTEGVIPLK